MAAEDHFPLDFITGPVILRHTGPSDEIKTQIEQLEKTREYLREKGTANFRAGAVLPGIDDALALLREIYELAAEAERALAEHKRYLPDKLAEAPIVPLEDEHGHFTYVRDPSTVYQDDPYRWNPEKGYAESVPGEKGGAPRSYWAEMVGLFLGAEQARLREETSDTKWNSLELRERIAVRLRPFGPPGWVLDTSRGGYLDRTIKNYRKQPHEGG